MSAQGVPDKLRNVPSGESCGGDGDQARVSDMGGCHVQFVNDIVYLDQRTPLVTTQLGLMGHQV